MGFAIQITQLQPDAVVIDASVGDADRPREATVIQTPAKGDVGVDLTFDRAVHTIHQIIQRLDIAVDGDVAGQRPVAVQCQTQRLGIIVYGQGHIGVGAKAAITAGRRVCGIGLKTQAVGVQNRIDAGIQSVVARVGQPCAGKRDVAAAVEIGGTDLADIDGARQCAFVIAAKGVDRHVVQIGRQVPHGAAVTAARSSRRQIGA